MARSLPRMGAGSGDKTQTLTLTRIPSARAGATVGAVATMLSEAVNACQRGAGSVQAARRRARGRPGRRRRDLSLAKTSSDSLRSTEIRQSVHRPKTPSLVGGRATGIVSPSALHGHTGVAMEDGERAGWVAELVL